MVTLRLLVFQETHCQTGSSNKGSQPGLSSKLVIVSLKSQMLISQICQKFLLKKYEKLLHCPPKASLIFSTKNISVFGNKVVTS